MDNSKIFIELSKNEALVLFEFLVRLNKEDSKSLFEDQAEQRVLWDLESIIEKELDEPLKLNYTDLLEKARTAIRDKS